MKNTTNWLTIAAAAVSLGWVGPAQAKALASATFAPLRVTLFDLNLTDGVAPAITFSGGNSFASVSVYDSVSSLYPSETADGVSAFQPLSVAAATPHGGASAHVTGAGGVSGASFDVSGQIFANGVTDNGFFSTANAAGNFSLTPWTAVRFDSANVAVTAKTTVGSDGAMQELASATVMFSVEVYHPGSSETHQSIRNTLAGAQATCDPVTGECTYAGESVVSQFEIRDA